MALKHLTINSTETLELYHKAKVKAVTANPYDRITDSKLLEVLLNNYLDT